MNNQEKYMDDLLKQYIIPERSEKAPEGFTSKIMTRVQLETAVVGRKQSKNLVPLISALVTCAINCSCISDSGKLKTDKLSDPVLNLIKNINIISSRVRLVSRFSELTLPSVTLYVVIGIFVLTLFDKALQGIFRKEK